MCNIFSNVTAYLHVCSFKLKVMGYELEATAELKDFSGVYNTTGRI